MNLTRTLFAIFHLTALLLIQGSPAYASSIKPVVPLLLSASLDKEGKLLPLQAETLELIQYLETSLAIKFDIRRYPWKRAMENVLNGEGIIYGMSKTAERQRKFVFSEPVFVDQTWLVTRCDSTFSFDSLLDLKGKKIGVVRGASSGDEFDQQKDILFKIEDDTDSSYGRFAKLYNRRMDALTYFWSGSSADQLELQLNKFFLGNIIASSEQDSSHSFCVLPKPISDVTIHFAIGNDQNMTYLKMIDKALLQAKKNGDLARIFKKEIKLKK